MKADEQKMLSDLLAQHDTETYAKMCSDREDKALLEEQKKALYEKLRRKTSSAPPSHKLAISFLKACKLQEHYVETVGNSTDILSTIQLETLPKFKVGKNPKIGNSINRLIKQYALSQHDLAEVEDSVKTSLQDLKTRKHAVSWLRAKMLGPNGSLDQEKVFALFNQLFPEHPLTTEQVNVVVTLTGVYWLIPKSLKAEDQQKWVNYYDRFSFNRFIHFPMFSGFEIRDSCHDIINDAMQQLDINFHETVEMLNSVISIQKREDVEKYIIHDTWGHIWQADLTHFKHLYDKMESLRRPMEASLSLTYPCGNVVCLADLYFPKKDQTIEIDTNEVEEFVKTWVNVHSSAVLAPLIAEMTADIVEYKFILDHPELEVKMPSSSVFKDDPAKFDFAWIDFSYFSRELRKIHRSHFEDPEYQESFNERLILLLEDRFKNRLSSWPEGKLEAQLKQATKVLLRTFEEIQDKELSNQLHQLPEGTKFFEILHALLSLQATVNHLIDHKLNANDNQNSGYFELLVLLIGIAFCDWREQSQNLNFSQWSKEISEQLTKLMEDAGA